MHNRIELPSDRGFKIRASKPPVKAMLTLNHVLDIVKSANLRDRSMILAKWMSLQDTTRIMWVGSHVTDQIVKQIEAKTHPVRIDIPIGRKSNNSPYYSYIGEDAVNALIEYFEKERDWPKKGEALWLEKPWKGIVRPLTAQGFSQMWLRTTRRMGLVPKQRGPVGSRYGYNTHEMRDVAKSMLHVNAMKDGLGMDCVMFWMGHGYKVDPSGYDKFWENQEYVREQYLIAEKHLNIVSGGGASTPSREELKRQEQEILTMKGEVARLIQLVQELQQQTEKESAAPTQKL